MSQVLKGRARLRKWHRSVKGGCLLGHEKEDVGSERELEMRKMKPIEHSLSK